MANDTPNPPVTESTLLAREADDAKKAIFNIFDQLRADLMHGVSPREITVKHPLAAIGASAVAGFVAASALVPGKEENLKGKFASWQAALLEKLTAHPSHNSAATEKSNGHSSTRKPPDEQKGSSLASVLAREAFQLLRPALLSAIGAAVSAKVAPAEPTYDDNSSVEPTDSR